MINLLEDLITLTLQLVHGKPDGIRICRVENEALLTVIIPRESLNEAKELPKIPERGIYYLLDESRGVISRVYTGQTTQGIACLESHKEKEFWNKAIMFLTDDPNISHVVNGLEAKAIAYVMSHGSYEKDNTQVPKPDVSPYSEGSIEQLHRSILFRMAALGYDLDNVHEGPSTRSLQFHIQKNGVIKASGCYDIDTDKLTVLAGSEIDLSNKTSYQAVTKLRSELFDSSTERGLLLRDVEPLSPSAAAAFVLGGSPNGRKVWINDQGQALDEMYPHKKG